MKLIFAVLLLGAAACAQNSSTIGNQPDNGPVVPTSCFIGQVYSQTGSGGGGVGFYFCNPANTFTKLGAGGSGTVTSFSAGTLSPLFTTSVATSTVTPALTFSLTAAAAGTIFGNATGASAGPTFTAAPVLGVAGTPGSLGLSGTTSGSCTLGVDATSVNLTHNCGLVLSGASGAATTISTTTANANLILAPNGTGSVQYNVGAAATPSIVSTVANTGFRYNSGAPVGWVYDAVGSDIFQFTAGGPNLSSTGTYKWGSSTAITAGDTGISRIAAATIAIGAGAQGNGAGFYKSSQIIQVVTANYTTTATTLATAGTVTGLTWTAPVNLASNWSFNCNIVYSQATAGAANLWGVATTGTAPTSMLVSANVYTTLAGASIQGTTVITSAQTGATAVTATPGVVGIIGTTAAMLNAQIFGTIEAPSNATPSSFQITVATGNASDALTIYRGSACTIN